MIVELFSFKNFNRQKITEAVPDSDEIEKNVSFQVP